MADPRPPGSRHGPRLRAPGGRDTRRSMASRAPGLDSRPWRRFLVQVVRDVRVAHLHLLPSDSERWTEQLAFRDALRQDPGLVQRYAAVKQQLAAAYADDREAHTAAKREFIDAVLRRDPA